MKTCVAGYLPNDLMFMIFLLLPIKTLIVLKSVCKSWNKLINCADFVEAYNRVAQSSLIFLTSVEGDVIDTLFHVESQANNKLENFSWDIRDSRVMKLLEVEDGKSKLIDLNVSCFGFIVATCNGLILIKSMFHENQLPVRRGRLILMNPMTKKIFGFPLGTLASQYLKNESYGLVFSHSQRVYKVVHLLKDEFGHITYEVWSMKTRCWKSIDGPSKFRFNRVPISVSGVLYWVPAHNLYRANHIVSMDAEDEIFRKIHDIPKPLGKHSRLLGMGGFLTLVTTLIVGSVDVWILKGLEWIKMDTIRLDSIARHVDNLDPKRHFIPYFAVNAKEMIFIQRMPDRRFYSYDFELKRAKEIEMTRDIRDTFRCQLVMPHSSTLATWEPLEPPRAKPEFWSYGGQEKNSLANIGIVKYIKENYLKRTLRSFF